MCHVRSITSFQRMLNSFDGSLEAYGHVLPEKFPRSQQTTRPEITNKQPKMIHEAW